MGKGLPTHQPPEIIIAALVNRFGPWHELSYIELMQSARILDIIHLFEVAPRGPSAGLTEQQLQRVVAIDEMAREEEEKERLLRERENA